MASSAGDVHCRLLFSWNAWPTRRTARFLDARPWGHTVRILDVVARCFPMAEGGGRRGNGDAAHAHGLRTAVVTNGILLDELHIESLRERLDLLAISIDGRPDLHNRIRASRRAFEIMADRLACLRAAAIPFGFVFTLSDESIDHLIWAIDFAVEQGARLFQIHPLDETGRARAHLRGHAPAARDASIAWLAALHLAQAYADRILISVDLLESTTIEALIPEVFSEQVIDISTRLADIVSPLVVDPRKIPLDRLRAEVLVVGAGMCTWRMQRRLSKTGLVVDPVAVLVLSPAQRFQGAVAAARACSTLRWQV